MTNCQGIIRRNDDTTRTCDKRTNLNLCPNCTNQLRDLFVDLPWWLDRLGETTLGLSRLADTTPPGNDTASNTPIKVNFRARDLADTIAKNLNRFRNTIAGTYGISWAHKTAQPEFIGPLPADWERANPANLTPARQSYWLARNVNAIASDELAATIHRDIDHAIKAIERTINRPEPRRFCGPCPTEIRDTNSGPLRQCAIQLTADPKAVTVICPECRQEHDVEELIEALWNELDYRKMTYPEIQATFKAIHAKPPPRRTLYNWVKDGRLKVRGYLRPDGRRIGASKRSDKDQPVYFVGDVRRLALTEPKSERRKVRT